MVMVGRLNSSSLDNITFLSLEHAGRVLQACIWSFLTDALCPHFSSKAAITSELGNRMARRLTVMPGSLGKTQFNHLLVTSEWQFTKVHPKNLTRVNIIQLYQMDTTWVATGLWKGQLLVAMLKVTGGRPTLNGGRTSSKKERKASNSLPSWVNSYRCPSQGVNHGIAQDGRIAILTVVRVWAFPPGSVSRDARPHYRLLH